VLKTPKTESSVRKIFIPKSVAKMLEKLKAGQDEMKSILGKDYQKYDLVIATDYGLPIGEAAIRKRFKKLIKDHDLPDVVFHSLRHYVECFYMVSLCKKHGILALLLSNTHHFIFIPTSQGKTSDPHLTSNL
jgi:integrase